MRSISAVAILSILVAAPAYAATVGSERDPDADFSAYRTYAWKIKIPEPSQDPTGERRKLDALIRTSADAALEARGFRRVDAQPDVWMVYSVVAEDRTHSRVYRGEVWEIERVAVYAGATLVFELRDGGSGDVVWRGWAEGGIKPSKREKRLPRIVRRILERLPPGSAK